MRLFAKVLCCFITCLFISSTASWAQQPVTIIVDVNQRAQTIQNFGASGCWFSEAVGRYWPDNTRARMAELLFSKQMDQKGNPKGIGLSAWRFNIGAGTAELGDSSRIKDANKRVECFLNADGTYNWNKQKGYLWFTKKARDYRVENLIAFVNSPPVYYTKNRLGFATLKDHHANLREDKYAAYADFLATVIAHFNEQNIHFNYISPVNEPQWDWYNSNQEGSPYSNTEIFNVVKALDGKLTQKHLNTRIITPEAGMLTYLYSTPGKTETGSQIQHFWRPGSNVYMGNFTHVEKLVAGHSYFTDGDKKSITDTRIHLADTAKKYSVDYWESEYSMLGDGFKEGAETPRSGMDCAIFLAKLIHHDLTEGNATAWEFWNAWEPGKPDFDTRYYLLALKPDKDFKSGTFEVTKNLWALGHYSRFIRPGMMRIKLSQPENQDLITTAFYGQKKLVMVLVNNSAMDRSFNLKITAGKFNKNFSCYTTTFFTGENMERTALRMGNKPIILKARSINTLVFDKSN